MKLAQMQEKSGLLGLKTLSGWKLSLAAFVVMALILGNLVILYSSLSTVQRHHQRVTQSHEFLFQLEETLSALNYAEGSARDFAASHEEPYSRRFEVGQTQVLESLRKLSLMIQDDPDLRRRAGNLRDQVTQILRMDAELIEFARRGSAAHANPDVQTLERLAQTRQRMDEIRLTVQDLKDSEQQLLRKRADEAETAAYRQKLSMLALACVSVLLVVLVYYYIRRSVQIQETEARRLSAENWLKTGLAEAGHLLRGKESLEEVGRSALEFFAAYLGMQVGVFYVVRHGALQRVASYAQNGTVPDVPATLGLRETLVGEAVQSQRLIELDEVPADYLNITSALGATTPRKLMILPLHSERSQQVGVIELGFLNALPAGALQLFEDLKSSLSVVVTSTLARQMQVELLEETQRQAEELAAQQEELRSSNEKLAHQTHELRHSQDQLQQQQEELRQSNEELEQQARAMEEQKQKLAEKNARLLAAKHELEAKAGELEQASRYKSEFLANMSHELRTPLNSLLLLATLLSENKEKNLTEKQVDFAKTIFRSGRDLLALINDILDLSKVEAGRLDLEPAPFALDELIDTLQRDFKLMAAEKGLAFEVGRAEGTPPTILTDGQRLLQIMKNLVSNALKFTEAGAVRVTIASGSGPTPLLFHVADTGIGIAPDKQAIIFEAFKQSDGSISRTYGGTGLGLTISRELAHLLGGHITVESRPGKGSTFTLHLPEAMPPVGEQKAPLRFQPEPPRTLNEAEPAAVAPSLTPSAPMPPPQPQDGKHLILVVEDDPDFGRIMVDLAHEAGFVSMLATTGEAALDWARQHRFSAVLLDIKLPDMSGLSILERLKSNPATRHIPIHVISGTDYAQNALALGALGYLRKPAQPDELKTIFARIETTLSRKVKRVLIVEDDKFQRQATKDLLGHGDIEIIEATSGTDARRKLWEESYDCVVLDLRLPDISGFALLEAMERELPGAKPPIVVYTAKELSREEQRRLERYAESIVIKGARSPERLLDEVSLFLHRLESSLPPQSRTLLQKLRSDAVGLKGRRILLVDDDMRNVYALINALETHGLKVTVARNGREALQHLAKDDGLELVLMDIMMPEMDGYEAMEAIRKDPARRKLPIIALTAKAMKGDLEQCLAAGANDYLPKPIQWDRLLSLLKVWLPQKI